MELLTIIIHASYYYSRHCRYDIGNRKKICNTFGLMVGSIRVVEQETGNTQITNIYIRKYVNASSTQTTQ